VWFYVSPLEEMDAFFVNLQLDDDDEFDCARFNFLATLFTISFTALLWDISGNAIIFSKVFIFPHIARDGLFPRACSVFERGEKKKFP
jgi:hypothetical protein